MIATNKKIISLFTAAVFLFSVAANDLYAAIAGVPAGQTDGNAAGDFRDMIRYKTLIPPSYGKVTSISDMQSDTAVIIIQDLHSHSNTQRNIAKIIEVIGSSHKLNGIYVEGGVGNIDTSWIDAIQDKEFKGRIIEQLLEDGDLTASEYYAMTAKDPYPVKGLENKAIHQANLKRLADLDANKEKYESVLKKMDKEIAILNKLYTNSRNVRFNKMIDRYNDGKITEAKFYKLLQKYVEKISANPEQYNVITKIDLDDYPNIQFYLKMLPAAERTDYKKLTGEIQLFLNSLKSVMPYNQFRQLTDETKNFSDMEKVTQFITEFFKAYPENAEKYEELGKLVKVNELVEALNPVELITEQRQLTEKIKFALSYDNTEAEIAFMTDFKKYFKDYLTAKLMQGDWAYVKENLEQFKEIFGKYAAYNALKEVEADLPEITRYYEVNTDRNSVFLSNLISREAVALGKNDKTGSVSAILSDAGDIMVAVAGGYHSEGLQELFAGKNISSIVITPNVTTDIKKAQIRYMEIVKEQAKFPANALAAALLSGTPNANQVAKIFQAAINTGATPAEIEKLIRDFKLSDRVSLENGNVVIDGQAKSLTQKSVGQDEIKAGFELLRTVNITEDFTFDALETGVLKTVGAALAYFGAGEAAIIPGVEKAGLKDAEFIAGAAMSEFAYYPAFIQEILLNKHLAKTRSVFMVSQQELNERMDRYQPTVYMYRKVPTFGIQIPKFRSRKAASGWLTALDKKFNKKLIEAIGSVDQMEWWGYVSNDEGNKARYAQIKAALENAVTDEEKKQILSDNAEFMNAGLIDQIFKNPGGIIALQDKVNIDGTSELDCYIIDLPGIGKYSKDGKLITLKNEEVNERNVDENGKTLEDRLSSLLGIDGLSAIDGIVGVHKQADEAMIRAEDIGLNIPAAATKQKQEMKNGAFFVLDKKGYPKYVVNAEGRGKPVLYEYVGEAKTDILEFANAGEAATNAEIDAFFESDMTISALTTKLLRGLIKKLKPQAFEFRKEAPIYGYKIPSELNTVADIDAFMESLPAGLIKKLGSVDNTKYRSFVDPYGGLTEEEYGIIEKMFGINREQLDRVKAEMLAAKTDDETAKVIESNGAFFKAAFQYQFFKDRGSVIALQMNGDSLDSYIIGSGAYGNYDKDVDVEQYYAGGRSLKEQLEREIGAPLETANIIGLKKKLKATATMIPAYTLGLNIPVASSASEKGQKTSSGAFIYIGKDDRGGWEWYIVNAEERSYKPIFYELVEVKKPAAPEAEKTVPEESDEEKVSRALFGYDAATANRILDEVRSNHALSSPLIGHMIINAVAGVEGYVTARIAMDGSIYAGYKLSESPLNPESVNIISTGLIAYLASGAADYKMISKAEDIAALPDYFKRMIDVLAKEGAYNLWKKGELTPSAEDAAYFERLEADAKALYEAKKAKLEELGKYVSHLDRDKLDSAQRTIYEYAATYYSNAKRQLREYYKDPSNPTFGELMAVGLSGNESVPDLARLKSLEKYIGELESLAASFDTELTLRWWPLNWPAEMTPWTNTGRAKRRAEKKAAELRLNESDTRDYIRDAVQKARERRATFISVSELPLTLLLPAKTFVLLHFNRNERKALKRYLAGDYSVLNEKGSRELLDKFAIRLEGERAIKRIEGASEKEIRETRLGGARGIKRQTAKWFAIGIPIVFAMFFLLDYTDRHVITTRPFGDLRWVSSGEAAKIVFSDLLNNMKQMAAVIAGAGMIGAIANAAAHRLHNLIPKVIRARATLDISESKAESLKEELYQAIVDREHAENARHIGYYNIAVQKIENLQAAIVREFGVYEADKIYNEQMQRYAARQHTLRLYKYADTVPEKKERTAPMALGKGESSYVNFIADYQRKAPSWSYVKDKMPVFKIHRDKDGKYTIRVTEAEVPSNGGYVRFAAPDAENAGNVNIDLDFFEDTISFVTEGDAFYIESLREKNVAFYEILTDIEPVGAGDVKLGNRIFALRPLNYERSYKNVGLAGNTKEIIEKNSRPKKVLDFYSFYEAYQKGDILPNGFVLGRTNIKMDRDRPDTDTERSALNAEVLPALAKLTRSLQWQDLHKRMYDGDRTVRTEDLLQYIVDQSRQNNVPIIFYLPANIARSEITLGELNWLLEEPSRMENVYFVVGAYDVLDVKAADYGMLDDFYTLDGDTFSDIFTDLLDKRAQRGAAAAAPEIKYPDVASMSIEAIQKELGGHYLFEDRNRYLPEELNRRVIELQQEIAKREIEDAKKSSESAASAAERSKAMMLLLQAIQYSPAHADMYMRVFPLFAEYSLGFASSAISDKDAGTAFVVYTTEKKLEKDIEQYGFIPGAVFIVNDMIGDKGVGINKNGVPLREVEHENKNIKVFSANGVSHDEINKYLQGSRILKNVSSFVVADTVNRTNISFDGDIIKVGIGLIENRMDGTIEEYIAELSEIQRKWRNAQADKNIFDIAHLAAADSATINSVINALAKQKTEQHIKIMLNESQLGVLMKALNERTLKELNMLGVEIFLSVESVSEERKTDMRISLPGISGVLVNDESLIDLSTGKELKARVFLKEGDLRDDTGKRTTLDDLLSDGEYEGYNIIGLNLMKDSVSGRNVLKNGGALNAALGWLGKTFNLKEISAQDAVNMARQTEFSKALRMDGELTEKAAKGKIGQLPGAQTMLRQLTREAKTAYEETLAATIIQLNMIERKKEELTAQGRLKEGEKMIIEKDPDLQKTLTQLIVKAMRTEGFVFNGADYLQAISAEADMDLTVNEIIARALKDDASKEDLELAIAVIADSEFVPIVVLKTNTKEDAQKQRARMSGVKAILYQA